MAHHGIRRLTRSKGTVRRMALRREAGVRSIQREYVASEGVVVVDESRTELDARVLVLIVQLSVTLYMGS